jgi:hypothetical protein
MDISTILEKHFRTARPQSPGRAPLVTGMAALHFTLLGWRFAQTLF